MQTIQFKLYTRCDFILIARLSFNLNQVSKKNLLTNINFRSIRDLIFTTTLLIIHFYFIARQKSNKWE